MCLYTFVYVSFHESELFAQNLRRYALLMGRSLSIAMSILFSVSITVGSEEDDCCQQSNSWPSLIETYDASAVTKCQWVHGKG